MNLSEYIDSANTEMQQMYREPLSVEEYIEYLFENPSLSSHSAKYLLEAIESSGTRTVVEHGEKYERYVFFDDPHNDGEHAILGNTKELNKFVSTLRNIASGTGKTEKMIWIEGPTATGKSEFKRCLINGLREYSKTVDGSRYTLEWSEKGSQASRGDPTYGNPTVQNRIWHQSPVQIHPLSIFPEDSLESILTDLNEPQRYPTKVSADLDPFSEEFFEQRSEEIRDDNSEGDDFFETVIDKDNVRVTNYVVDVGNGIGVLHSEDVGNIKQKLVGGWLQNQNVWSKGRRNPLAFSYDGVLCQGNSLLTVLEDASSHTDLLTSLLNVIDEQQVKLDQQTTLPIDTQFIILSNPDLEEFLSQYAEQEGDPLKALRRRLEKHTFNYLTNYTLESKLLKRELGQDEYDVEFNDEINVCEPVFVQTYNPETVTAREIAPHGIEAAAMYNVITRLSRDGLSTSDFSLADKAILFDSGELYRGDTKYELEDVPFDINSGDGSSGIPVTFTRDIIAEAITSDHSEDHPEFPDVILPQDILSDMKNKLEDEPVFNQKEVKQFKERSEEAENYIFERQQRTVLQSAMDGLETSEESIEQYIDEVYNWYEQEQLQAEFSSDRDDEIDSLSMKLFEIEELGMFEDENYDNSYRPTSEEVIEFRKDHIINTLNSKAWESKKEDFTVDDLEIHSMEIFNRVLQNYGWRDIRREFPDFDPSKWENPPEGTETEEVKEKVISNMVDIYNYTEKSAELTSKIVIEEVSKTWD